METEVSTLQKLQGCPYVVRLHEAAFVGQAGPPAAAFVLLDYCQDTLVSYLKQHAFRLDEAVLLHIFLPVCRAVEAMHSLQPPLSHRHAAALVIGLCFCPACHESADCACWYSPEPLLFPAGTSRRKTSC